MSRRFAVLALVLLAACGGDDESKAEATCKEMRAAAEFSMKDAQRIFDLAVIESVGEGEEGFVDELRKECGANFVARVDGS